MRWPLPCQARPRRDRTPEPFCLGLHPDRPFGLAMLVVTYRLRAARQDHEPFWPWQRIRQRDRFTRLLAANADIMLRTDGEVRAVSSRPSDAIALAIRIGSPIFAEEDVLDEAGRTEQPDAEEAEAMVEEFRAFIDHVNPEDFAQ